MKIAFFKAAMKKGYLRSSAENQHFPLTQTTMQNIIAPWKYEK